MQNTTIWWLIHAVQLISLLTLHVALLFKQGHTDHDRTSLYARDLRAIGPLILESAAVHSSKKICIASSFSNVRISKSIDRLVFNGMSAQKGQFMQLQGSQRVAWVLTTTTLQQLLAHVGSILRDCASIKKSKQYKKALLQVQESLSMPMPNWTDQFFGSLIIDCEAYRQNIYIFFALHFNNQERKQSSWTTEQLHLNTNLKYE